MSQPSLPLSVEEACESLGISPLVGEQLLTLIGRPAGPTMLTLAQTCRRLGISRRTGEDLLAQGKFPVPEFPRFCRRRFWSSVEVDDFIANETRRRLEESRAYTTQLRRVR